MYVTEGWVIEQKCHVLSIEMQSGTTFNNLSPSATFFRQLQSNTTFNLSLPANFLSAVIIYNHGNIHMFFKIIF